MSQHMHNKRSKSTVLDVQRMANAVQVSTIAWFWCSTYIHGVSLCSKIIYNVSTKNTTKQSAFQLSWKIPHVGMEERAQTEHTQMSMRANAMKMFLSGADQTRALARNSVFWEVPWWEKAQHQADHSRPAWPAPTSKEGHVPQQGNTLQQGATDRQGFWQSISSTAVMYVTQYTEK